MAGKKAINQDDRPVGLLDPVLGKRGAKLLPPILLRCQQQNARGVDVEAVNHTAAQTAFAHPVDLRPAGEQPVQDGVGLLLAKRVDGHARGLVDRDPARPLGNQGRRASLALARPLLPRAVEGGNLHDPVGIQSVTLRRAGQGATPDTHRATLQQPADLGAGELQSIGEEAVQALSAIGFSDRERLGETRHSLSLARVSPHSGGPPGTSVDRQQRRAKLCPAQETA